MRAELQKEHEWLAQFVGDWTFEIDATAGPGQPPERSTGTETVLSLDGAWILCEGKGEMPDGDFARSLMTLGYDPARQRFVGTFVSSMMTYLWIYEGELDSAGSVLTLDTEGPTFSDAGGMAKYRDVIELRNRDHRVMTSAYMDDAGNWQRFMTAHYRRSGAGS